SARLPRRTRRRLGNETQQGLTALAWRRAAGTKASTRQTPWQHYRTSGDRGGCAPRYRLWAFNLTPPLMDPPPSDWAGWSSAASPLSTSSVTWTARPGECGTFPGFFIATTGNELSCGKRSVQRQERSSTESGGARTRPKTRRWLPGLFSTTVTSPPCDGR